MSKKQPSPSILFLHAYVHCAANFQGLEYCFKSH